VSGVDQILTFNDKTSIAVETDTGSLVVSGTAAIAGEVVFAE
jgi:hypothetical protein